MYTQTIDLLLDLGQFYAILPTMQTQCIVYNVLVYKVQSGEKNAFVHNVQ